MTGVLAGWVVDRLAVCWPVSWDVVVAVDIGFLTEKVIGHFPACFCAARTSGRERYESVAEAPTGDSGPVSEACAGRT